MPIPEAQVRWTLQPEKLTVFCIDRSVSGKSPGESAAWSGTLELG